MKKKKNKANEFFYLFVVFSVNFKKFVYSEEINIITKNYDILEEKIITKTFSYYLCTFKQFSKFKYDLISYSRKKMLVKGSVKMFTEKTSDKSYYDTIKSL